MSEFGGAGKAAGLEIWRIEKLVPTPWPKEMYGQFHSGDSYIVLKTNQKGSGGGFTWDLHFWLGKETSQDEAGVAAYKTVELDESLGGGPVQHREVQGSESPLFLSYFKQGVCYLDGGVEAGFRHVDRDAHETRLFHIKGKRNVRVSQVPAACDSLNQGDVFVLDTGKVVYQWNGSKANRNEKAKGLDYVTSLKNQTHGGKAAVVVLNEGDDNSDFWSALGGKGTIKSEAEGGSDAQAEAQPVKLCALCTDGEVAVLESNPKNLKKSMLETGKMYVVDDGRQAWVWIGKGAPADVKKEAMTAGGKYLAKTGRANAPLSRIVENAETPIFKSMFALWDAPATPVDFSRPSSNSNVAASPRASVDVKTLHKRRQSQLSCVDDGSGSTKVWRIENFKEVEVPADQHGQFYAGDSYIVLYTYQRHGKDNYILYFWQGRDSSADEKGASAILTTKIDDSLGGAPVQCRVEQNKEPAHFYTLWKGGMVVRKGGHPSGFSSQTEIDQAPTDGNSLFHVRGTNALNTRAIQVECQASNLNSGDVFVVATGSAVYQWNGSGSSEEERSIGARVAGKLASGRTVTSFEEGSESDELWSILGGKAEYASFSELANPHGIEPRLFHVSNATGAIQAEEIVDFCQDDLADDDVMILDVYSELFVWIGSQANEAEKKGAKEVADEYLATASESRAGTSIAVVAAGNEPLNFTCHFIGWDHEKAKGFVDPYEARLARMEQQRPSGTSAMLSDQMAKMGVQSPAPEEKLASRASSGSAAGMYAGATDSEALRKSISANYADPASAKFSYDELKGDAYKSNPSINPIAREEYLSDADFESVFGMKRDVYTKMPQWKKNDAKKKALLF